MPHREVIRIPSGGSTRKGQGGKCPPQKCPSRKQDQFRTINRGNARKGRGDGKNGSGSQKKDDQKESPSRNGTKKKQWERVDVL